MRNGMAQSVRLILVAILLAAAAGVAAVAEESNPASEVQKAWDAAMKAATNGPADVPFRDLATVHLADPYAFVPSSEGAAFMRALGNSSDERFVGLIVPKASDQFWFVTVDYNDTGHVSDDDAKSWNADELLQSIKNGTEEGNKDRISRGIAALDIKGWIEPPAYDAASHRLVWSILAKDRGSTPDAGAIVNYNTYALGREGYFELDLVTGEQSIAADKPHAAKLLANLVYKEGQRYDDFKASSDRLAEFGLAALIGGVVAKKVGFLALIGVALLKFWKLALIGLPIAGGVLTRFFKRKGPSS
jgi:uncharacterized membrane-anchored protein